MKWEVAWSIAFLFNLFLLLLLQWWRKQTRKRNFCYTQFPPICLLILYSLIYILYFSLYFLSCFSCCCCCCCHFFIIIIIFIPLRFSQSTSLNLIYFNSWKRTTHNSFLYISQLCTYTFLYLYAKCLKHNLYLYIIVFVCINIYISSTKICRDDNRNERSYVRL